MIPQFHRGAAALRGDDGLTTRTERAQRTGAELGTRGKFKMQVAVSGFVKRFRVPECFEVAPDRVAATSAACSGIELNKCDSVNG